MKEDIFDDGGKKQLGDKLPYVVEELDKEEEEEDEEEEEEEKKKKGKKGNGEGFSTRSNDNDITLLIEPYIVFYHLCNDTSKLRADTNSSILHSRKRKNGFQHGVYTP